MFGQKYICRNPTRDVSKNEFRSYFVCDDDEIVIEKILWTVCFDFFELFTYSSYLTRYVYLALVSSKKKEEERKWQHLVLPKQLL